MGENERQLAQELFTSNHVLMQGLWNTWLQSGKRTHSSSPTPYARSLIHMLQYSAFSILVGGSAGDNRYLIALAFPGGISFGIFAGTKKSPCSRAPIIGNSPIIGTSKCTTILMQSWLTRPCPTAYVLFNLYIREDKMIGVSYIVVTYHYLKKS